MVNTNLMEIYHFDNLCFLNFRVCVKKLFDFSKIIKFSYI